MVAVRSVTEITPRASIRLKVWLHLSTKSRAGALRPAATRSVASAS